MAAFAPQVIQHPATHVPPGQGRKLHPAAAVEPPGGLAQAQGTLLEKVIPEFCITARVARRPGPQCHAKFEKQLALVQDDGIATVAVESVGEGRGAEARRFVSRVRFHKMS
jgi:hypothetical protein